MCAPVYSIIKQSTKPVFFPICTPRFGRRKSIHCPPDNVRTAGDYIRWGLPPTVCFSPPAEAGVTSHLIFTVKHTVITVSIAFCIFYYKQKPGNCAYTDPVQFPGLFLQTADPAATSARFESASALLLRSVSAFVSYSRYITGSTGAPSFVISKTRLLPSTQ